MGFLSSIGDLGGSLISAGLNFLGAKDTNETSKELSREQMAFQERMSSTAYQRAVQDMQAAGLNPMLAYSQGGASTPGGAQPPKLENPMAHAVAGAQQAASTLSAIQQVQQQKAQTEQIQAATTKIKSETLEQALHTAKLKNEVSLLNQQADKTYAERVTEGKRTHLVAAQEDSERVRKELLGWQRDLAQIEATVSGDTFGASVAKRKAESLITQYDVPRARSEAKFYENIGELNPYIRQAIDFLSGANSAKSLLRDLPRGVHMRK